ncbi:hypothetical protein NC651_007516 [Populus alba x Populus x berolinensis]|nr:hypothetical protein NC651_007516 [Populus alba x Populus x berolinensis]
MAELRSKIFPKWGLFECSLWDINLVLFGWSIHNSQELIKRSCGGRIGMGNMVNIWNDALLIDDNNRFIETQVVKGP